MRWGQTQTWKHGTHLYHEPSPSGAELEESVARLETERLEHVVDLAVLGRLEVAVRRALEQVAADAALCVGPERARVHHLLAQERLRAVARRACGCAMGVSKYVAEPNKGDAYLEELV